MSQVSAPVSTTVIAGDIAGATAYSAAVIEGFERVLAAARGLGFVTQEPGRPNLTLTLAPDQELALPLDTLASTAASFDATASPLRLRLVLHFGVVFRTESPEGTSYVGSAIRSTQSVLRRSPATGGLRATAEFAAHAATIGNLPFRLQPCAEPAALDGLSRLVFGVAPGASPAGSGNGGVDAEFMAYAKRRLAQEIGPFANALVDRTVRSVTSTEQVVALLCNEIDNPAARKKFEDDLKRFANMRA
ncbi:MAG: hypothetical protein HZA62_07225 [Rhodocyclales bacterium]|nr:hypothetical protein [Rhodocyclales bacterium]